MAGGPALNPHKKDSPTLPLNRRGGLLLIALLFLLRALAPRKEGNQPLQLSLPFTPLIGFHSLSALFFHQ